MAEASSGDDDGFSRPVSMTVAGRSHGTALRGGLVWAGLAAVGLWTAGVTSIIVWLAATALTFGLGLTVALSSHSGPSLLPDRVVMKLHRAEFDGIVIRRSTPADAPLVVATIDDEVLRANGLPEDIIEQMDEIIRTPGDADQAGMFVVCSSGTESEVHGVAEIYNYDERSRVADLGLWLGPSSRGKGIAERAIRAAALLAAGADIEALRIGSSTDNLRMLSAIRRSGARFVEEGPYTLPDGTSVISSWWILRCEVPPTRSVVD